jgi:hypothetical protein
MKPTNVPTLGISDKTGLSSTQICSTPTEPVDSKSSNHTDPIASNSTDPVATNSSTPTDPVASNSTTNAKPRKPGHSRVSKKGKMSPLTNIEAARIEKLKKREIYEGKQDILHKAQLREIQVIMERRKKLHLDRMEREKMLILAKMEMEEKLHSARMERESKQQQQELELRRLHLELLQKRLPPFM